MVIMGDINPDWLKWSFIDYLVNLVELVKLFLADSAMHQTVKEPTRFASVGEGLTGSLIDHCYVTNCDKFTCPATVSVGDSDHLGLYTRKITRTPVTKPRTIRKRGYRNFYPEAL